MPDYSDRRFSGFPDFERTKPSLSDEEVLQLRDLLTSSPTQTSDFPQVTANVNDLPLPLGVLVLRISTDGGGPYQVTGFAGVLGPRNLFFRNLGPSTLQLINESGSSAAEHRISIGSGSANVAANKTAHLVYDSIGKRWVLIAVTP